MKCRQCGHEPKLNDDRAKRIAKLEAALAWYADGDMYLRRGLASEFDPLAMIDGGALARQAVPHWENVEAARSPHAE